MIDTHVHCNYSKDCFSSIGEMAKAGQSKGLQGMCFTTHFEPNRLNPKRNTIAIEEISQYMKDVEKANTEYSLDIYCGLEIGYEPEKEKLVEDILAEFSFDYVIGSIHFIGEYPASDSKSGRILYEKHGDNYFTIYFDKMNKLVESNLFDAVGHLDVVAKGPGMDENETVEVYYERAVETIAKMKKQDMAFELNASGWDWIGRSYPHEKLLSELFGLPVLYGSDSHSPEEVGRYTNKTVELLKSVGFDELSYFVQRKRKTYRI